MAIVFMFAPCSASPDHGGAKDQTSLVIGWPLKNSDPVRIIPVTRHHADVQDCIMPDGGLLICVNRQHFIIVYRRHRSNWKELTMPSLRDAARPITSETLYIDGGYHIID
jgi:hypothetical protein